MKIKVIGRGFSGYTRRQRREMTLAKAKEIARERGLPRRVMHLIRKDLMRNFPVGTVEG